MKGIISALFMMIASFATAQSADLSPAAQSVAEARKAISDKPTQYAGYNLLAVALVHRAEETFRHSLLHSS